MELSQVVQHIQYVLAPAVMISSSALLLLGFQNKFSNLSSRYRTLNHEHRLLSQKSTRDALETKRLTSLEEQIPQLLKRAGYVKSAILLTYQAIVCFLLSSMFIFLNMHTNFSLYLVTMIFFFIGLILILISSLYMMVETQIAFNIVRIEHNA